VTYITVYGLVLASQQHASLFTKNIFAFHTHAFYKNKYGDQELR